MLNTTMGSPDVASRLAQQHIDDLIATHQRDARARVARPQASATRRVVGSFVISLGQRLAGCDAAPTLVGRSVA